MFIVNDWAAQYFQDLLHNSTDGATYGLAYFRSRGFRDDIIQKFQLGYDLTDRAALARTAISKGYREEFLLKTGICYKTEQGDLIDRYAGRVMFPWIGVNGKVVGFGGRLLDARTKGVNQKYVNSPESEIYHKDHELYGIFQAKKAVARKSRVFSRGLHRRYIYAPMRNRECSGQFGYCTQRTSNSHAPPFHVEYHVVVRW